MVFDPELVKQVFQGSNEQLHAGEANALLGPIVGERSVLLLDGAEHLRHRKLMLPGRSTAARCSPTLETMRACADLEIDSWPVGEPFALLRSDAVADAAGDPASGVRLRARPGRGRAARPAAGDGRAAGAPARADDRGGARPPAPDPSAAARAFERRKRAVDEIVYAEIARRREEPDLDQRDDVFSALLLARDEHGQPLTDREVRDELLTLLLAGHETTATGLAWTFDLLLHDQRVLAIARERDDALPRRGRQGGAADPPGDPGRRARRPRGAVRAQRLRGAGRASRSTRRSARSTAAPTCTRARRCSGPSGSSDPTRPTPTPGSRSAAAPAAAWAPASR